MNNKDLVAKAVYDAVKDDLTLEQVEQLLENPKSAEHGECCISSLFISKSLPKSATANRCRFSRKKSILPTLRKNRSCRTLLELFMNKELISKKVLQTVVKRKRTLWG